MRVFAIADASKRKASPIGVLFWEPSDTDEQGRFTLGLSSMCDETALPLSLSFCAQREGRRATPDESRRWVESRIVPEDRHNITEILMANGLARYDEASLLSACKGRSSDDDFLVYEIDAPDSLVTALDAHNPEKPLADQVLEVIACRRAAGEVRYAFVGLEEHDDELASVSRSAAQRIGASIRSQRLEAGLTQKQLAARAGITQTVLSRTESGSGNPTLSLLEDLAAALGVKLEISLKT